MLIDLIPSVFKLTRRFVVQRINAGKDSGSERLYVRQNSCGEDLEICIGECFMTNYPRRFEVAEHDDQPRLASSSRSDDGRFSEGFRSRKQLARFVDAVMVAIVCLSLDVTRRCRMPNGPVDLRSLPSKRQNQDQELVLAYRTRTRSDSHASHIWAAEDATPLAIIFHGYHLEKAMHLTTLSTSARTDHFDRELATALLITRERYVVPYLI